ncbi:MAG TPA: hypothetical protein VH309_13220 [Elusimicrobiota bacterium]|jgi:hypothetical protein|nr:hypothetical protein [Elusimicrobiota bacterium]
MRKQTIAALSLAAGVFLAAARASHASGKSGPPRDTPPSGNAPSSPPADGETYSPFTNFGKTTGGDPVKDLFQQPGPYTGFGGPAVTKRAGPPILENDGGPQDPPPPAAPLPGQKSPSVAADGDKIPWEDAGKVDPDGAEENFPNLVETFLAKHGSHGRWTRTAGSKKQTLEFLSIDTSRLKKVGPLYAACVEFRETGTRRRVRLEFAADFTGPEWKVVSVKPRSRGGPCAE